LGYGGKGNIWWGTERPWALGYGGKGNYGGAQSVRGPWVTGERVIYGGIAIERTEDKIAWKGTA
jgi:hypothetical protein